MVDRFEKINSEAIKYAKEIIADYSKEIKVISKYAVQIEKEIRKSKLENKRMPGLSIVELLSVSFLIHFGVKDKNGIRDLEEDIRDEALLNHLEEAAYRYEKILHKFKDSIPQKYTLGIILFYMSTESFSRINYYSTPDELNRLIVKHLDIRDGDMVCDLGSGYGDFLKNVYISNSQIKAFGYDTERSLNIIAKLKLYLIDINVNIVNEDIFRIEDSSFDKILCFPSFNQSYGPRPSELAKHRNLYKEVGLDERKKGSFQWIYALKALSLLKDGGRLVMVMSMDAATLAQDADIRECMVERGLIEKVIGLPKGILKYTRAEVVMIVFSKGNGSIEMIDMSNLRKDESVEAGRMTVDLQSIRDSRFQLNPNRYIGTDMFEKTEKISDCFEIIRGSSISKTELESITVEYETDTGFVNIGDIQEDMIESVQYLVPETGSERVLKDSLREGDILLSRAGTPIKLAIVEGMGSSTLYFSGNLYALRAKNEKINPYYLKMFLESEYGWRLLNSVSLGTAIPMISIKDLGDIRVPVYDEDSMREATEKYYSEKKRIRAKREKLKNELNRMYDDVNRFFCKN